MANTMPIPALSMILVPRGVLGVFEPGLSVFVRTGPLGAAKFGSVEILGSVDIVS